MYVDNNGVDFLLVEDNHTKSSKIRKDFSFYSSQAMAEIPELYLMFTNGFTDRFRKGPAMTRCLATYRR
jgi:hypothetical protein